VPTVSGRHFRIGFFGVVALVLLRVTVGWHIFYEGLWKHEQEEFSSEGYLGMTSGPFEKFFQERVVPDFEGRKRLSAEWNAEQMDRYHTRFVNQFDLEGNDKAIADRALAARKSNVQQTLAVAENHKLIADHFAAWDKLNDKKSLVEEGKAGAPFENQRHWEATQKLRAEARPWIAAVEAQYDGLKSDLQGILPLDRRDEKLKRSWTDLARDPDAIITYSCIAIGFCLMIGLFTRLAGLGATIFLALVVAAKLQWPGYYSPPTHPAQGHSLIVTKEFVEMIACLVLTFVPVGRWGGVDFVLHHIFVRPFKSQKP
jgi:uncharacterized membrane protein YphA (DoxX/SURF4 family)